MNLYLRLAWLLLTYRFKPRLSFTDALERPMTVMPGDLDLNGHVNNGRYLTLVDLAVIELFLRSGVLLKAWRHGWRPMVGASMITYRRGLKLLARYTLRFHLQSWDERWNYFRFEFVNGGRIVAAGYAKGAMVGRHGWVGNTLGDARLGIRRAPVVPVPALLHWIAAEQAMADEFSR
jgi:acyl-CoA thioesterase FadM